MTPYHIVERPERDQLGETPFWDEETQTLFWCDIVGKEVRRLDPSTGRIERWPMPRYASGIVPTTDGHAVVMLTDGVYRIDFGGGHLTEFARPDTDPRNRSNEVRTDPQGRLWLGSMGNNIGPNGEDIPQERQGGGSVFCVTGAGYAKRMLADIGITNTFCWSPKGDRFYTADTTRRVIWSFAYDPDSPALHDRQVFEEGDAAPGNPDGASMDEEGCLWSARWGAGRLVRFTPDGRVDRTIELPVKQPSSCAFGGADRKTLYITTARQGQDDLAPDALDGSLFVVEVDVAGLPMPRFKV
jgi:sugar lactone lactonase YvrE